MSDKIKQVIEKIDMNFYFIFFVGIVGYVFKATRPLMRALTPAVLFLTAAYALARTYYGLERRKRGVFAAWCLAVTVTTIFLEILGVRYGLFFGQYKYGTVLGPGVMGVPLIIGINWLIVVMGAAVLAGRYTGRILFIAAGAGLIAFLFDFVLEPAAISLGFWDWEGSIPVKNYVSWFSITFVFSAAAGLLKLDMPGKWSRDLLLAQSAFFVIIRIFLFINVF